MPSTVRRAGAAVAGQQAAAAWHAQPWICMLVLLSAWMMPSGMAAEDIPHVDSCNFCQKCLVDGETPGAVSTPHHTRAVRAIPYVGKGAEGALLREPIADPELAEDEALVSKQLKQQPQPDATPAWQTWPASMPRIMHANRLQPGQTFLELLKPLHVQDKEALPNCTVCRGCNAKLQDISVQVQQFTSDQSATRVKFQHQAGDSSTWTFFAWPAGSSTRFIVKLFCVPFSKAAMDGGQATVSYVRRHKCAARTYAARISTVLALQHLFLDCQAGELTPKSWLAPLNAVIPDLGFHYNGYALWMEEARGITLQALYMSRADKLAAKLFMNQMNKTQVITAAALDLLTAQCDRHSGNIFIDGSGQLQLIDNDKSLGAVPGCGYDSMLIPGSRYHSFLRIGPLNPLTQWYRRNGKTPGFCSGPVNPMFVVDYRCWTGNTTGELHTKYPPAVAACLSRLASFSVPNTMARLGLASRLSAEILRTRAADMLSKGFEWTLKQGLPANGIRYAMQPQPSCCALQETAQHGVACKHCWSPLLAGELQ